MQLLFSWTNSRQSMLILMNEKRMILKRRQWVMNSSDFSSLHHYYRGHVLVLVVNEWRTSGATLRLTRSRQRLHKGRAQMLPMNAGVDRSDILSSLLVLFSLLNLRDQIWQLETVRCVWNGYTIIIIKKTLHLKKVVYYWCKLLKGS